MPTPDTRHSIVIIKQFTYRGATRDFSNRYHFTDTSLPTSGEWEALANAIVLIEKTCYESEVTIKEAIGYDSSTATSTNPHGISVFNKTYAVAGTGSFAAYSGVPGDCAALVRYSTDARTSKNHPIYLFNYFHGIGRDTGEDRDTLNDAQHVAFSAYAQDWVDGFSDGSTTRVRCGPRGAVAQSRFVHGQIYHRDFPD